MSRNRNLMLSSLTLSIFFAIAGYIAFESIENETKANTELTEQQVYWSYEEGTVSEAQVGLDSGYKACAKGEAQSPINIETANIEAINKVEDVAINYDEASFSLLNDGYTIKAIAETKNNSIIISGEDFKLTEIHFHNPSEHQLEGSHHEMEAHLVHKNNEGELAVVGLFIENGEMNSVLSDIWALLPKEVTESYIAVDDPINLVNLLPAQLNIFQYIGSLTTPPCTEGVQWYIIEQPIQMSSEQILQFTNIFSNNSRPIQSINDRKVYELMIER